MQTPKFELDTHVVIKSIHPICDLTDNELKLLETVIGASGVIDTIMRIPDGRIAYGLCNVDDPRLVDGLILEEDLEHATNSRR
jgi:hypothetical protein